MKLSENNFVKGIGDSSSIFKYVGLISMWIRLIYYQSSEVFFEIFENKIGLEIILSISIFFLVGLGQNIQSEKETQKSKKLYLLFFFIFLTFILFFTKEDRQVLISALIILSGNFIGFITQSGDYSKEGNDDFITGRGPIFCFALGVAYGIPVGLFLQYVDLWESSLAVGNAVIGYYLILLYFEFKYFMKTI